jgi:hypothetical protein
MMIRAVAAATRPVVTILALSFSAVGELELEYES